MRLPTIRGLIDRRLLLNFRVDPDVMRRLLPAPFRPQIVGGYAMAGICLIRLRYIRPRFVPAGLGIASENAAHRIAVEWDTPNGPATGVFIPRRDTSSRLNTLAGGRLFPGVHHHARFVVHEGDSRYRVEVHSDDYDVQLAVEGAESHAWPHGSVFQSLEEASQFFACGSLGYSATNRRGVFDGLELCTPRLARRAFGDRAHRIELFRRSGPLSAWLDHVRQCPADARCGPRMAQPSGD